MKVPGKIKQEIQCSGEGWEQLVEVERDIMYIVVGMSKTKGGKRGNNEVVSDEKTGGGTGK